jgi:hypothetical protein
MFDLKSVLTTLPMAGQIQQQRRSDQWRIEGWVYSIRAATINGVSNDSIPEFVKTK